MGCQGNNKMTVKIYATNRKAKFDYHIEDVIDAGVRLLGWEVKSILASNATIGESYVTFIGDEVFLVGAHFTPPLYASKFDDTDPSRSRKLLMTRQQIDKWKEKVRQSGYTIVILDIHVQEEGGKIKAKIGLAKGKKQYDKRNAIKERETKVQIDRELKNV